MEKPTITKDHIIPGFESQFVNIYDLQYFEGRHYFNASRQKKDKQRCLLTEEEFKNMLPDAVSCFVIVVEKGKEPKLLMTYEFRYPVGQFLLSPPAGLLDERDADLDNPIFAAAKREIHEETGLEFKDGDTISMVTPNVFGSPGITDESNALICAVYHVEDTSSLTQEGAEGTECFDGFELLSEEEARQILINGKDKHGIFFSVFTWMALAWFVGGFWK